MPELDHYKHVKDMTNDKKKTAVQAVPEKSSDVYQGMKTAPPAEPVLITQAEPIQRPKLKEIKTSPPPEPPPKQEGNSKS